MSKQRQQRKQEEIRKTILDTARTIIARDGVDGLSIRKLTHAMDYSPAIVYHYFKDKNEIILSLVNEGYGKILAAIAAESRAGEHGKDIAGVHPEHNSTGDYAKQHTGDLAEHHTRDHTEYHTGQQAEHHTRDQAEHHTGDQPGVRAGVDSAVNPPDDPKQQITGRFSAYIRAALSFPDEYKAFMLHDDPSILARTSLLEHGISNRSETMRLLRDTIESGVAQGQFAPCDAELTAQVLWAAVFGLTMKLIMEKNVEAEQTERLVERQLSLLMRGLGGEA
ncbi:MAG: transcriptional regulator, TetR family [Paenibacillaceae bacterium]|nr:transcriptional regulator, TetR family [Paenibacillaceae bacterium]